MSAIPPPPEEGEDAQGNYEHAEEEDVYMLRVAPDKLVRLVFPDAVASELCPKGAQLTGAVKCWGNNGHGQLGNGATVGSGPANVVGDVSNAGKVVIQGGVLVHKESSTGTIAGHVTPIPRSMKKTNTGTQALMVTYDPLAAAAVFH